MENLTLRPILSNLREALGELERTHERLHFLTFGELPEDCHWLGDASDCIARLRRQESRNPLDEMTLFTSFEHAYHHLNWAWNCRRTPEERVRRCADNDASRWTRFPDTAVFADLWPCDVKVRKRVGELQSGKVSLTPVRLAVYMACRKLRILCYLVALRLGEEMDRPQSLKPGVDALPLTEKVFAYHLHCVYSELNTAWNSRKDKTFLTSKRAIARRKLYPSIFATGCHNMWRK